VATFILILKLFCVVPGIATAKIWVYNPKRG